jgi:hypothetical protein
MQSSSNNIRPGLAQQHRKIQSLDFKNGIFYPFFRFFVKVKLIYTAFCSYYGVLPKSLNIRIRADVHCQTTVQTIKRVHAAMRK